MSNGTLPKHVEELKAIIEAGRSARLKKKTWKELKEWVIRPVLTNAKLALDLLMIECKVQPDNGVITLIVGRDGTDNLTFTMEEESIRITSSRPELDETLPNGDVTEDSAYAKTKAFFKLLGEVY